MTSSRWENIVDVRSRSMIWSESSRFISKRATQQVLVSLIYFLLSPRPDYSINYCADWIWVEFSTLIICQIFYCLFSHGTILKKQILDINYYFYFGYHIDEALLISSTRRPWKCCSTSGRREHLIVMVLRMFPLGNGWCCSQNGRCFRKRPMTVMANEKKASFIKCMSVNGWMYMM